ncbi:MAG: single-stranded-DNA-specific exonuclease RecJ [Faecalibacterium sp.]|nr:single-stranded-DNA-specific exonuclease RecJ [Faecalibacterium sp.]
MLYRAWEPRTVDHALAAALAKALAQNAVDRMAEAAPEMPGEAELQRALAEKTQEYLLLAGVLCARGTTDPAAAEAFLAGEMPLPDPRSLKDMDKACARIRAAVEAEETIVIFGDYDVDGVTATALLFDHLRSSMGAAAKCMLPSREGDGYGLTKNAIDAIHKKGYTLIVTVDNGVSAVEEAAYAASLGIDLIITDHHLPPDTLPQAVAVVDPNRKDDTSAFKSFSGAGVAFLLCAALDECPAEEMLDFCGDLAAIGTVADVMPLTGENRTLVTAGLAALQNTERPGLAALLEVAGLADKPVTAESISFALAPRINAAGRMDSAVTALQLVLCEDESRAAQLAEKLNEDNLARQQIEQDIAAAAKSQLEADPARAEDRIVLVWGKNWHPGVIGIVASRLVEQLGRPVIVISIDEKGEGKGSGRSLGNFNLHRCITACSDLLIRFGGHALAAGLSVEEKNLPELRRRMNAWAAKEYPVIQCPPVRPDLSVRLDKMSLAAVAALEKLAPFGSGNPTPLFLLENAVIEGVYPVSEGRHCRLRLRQGSTSFYAVYFGMAPARLPYAAGDTVDAVLTLSVYEGRGGAQYSGRIQELRPAGLGNAPAEQAAEFEAFCGGAALEKAQLEALRPARADVIRTYQAVRAGKVHADDLQPLFACLGAEQTGKTLAGLLALQQLGLIARAEKDGAAWFEPVPCTEKKDLAQAPILKRMEEL